MLRFGARRRAREAATKAYWRELDERYQEYLREVSQGHLVPTSYQTIPAGVYNTLVIGPDVVDVTLENVIILGEVRIEGRGIMGRILVPAANPVPSPGRNAVVIERNHWGVLMGRMP
jgi:hypothetical protein